MERRGRRSAKKNIKSPLTSIEEGKEVKREYGTTLRELIKRLKQVTAESAQRIYREVTQAVLEQWKQYTKKW